LPLCEKDLEGHFTQGDVKPDAPAAPLGGEAGGDGAPPPGEPPASETPSTPSEAVGGDAQLARALDVLKSYSAYQRLRGGEAPATSASAAPVPGEASHP